MKRTPLKRKTTLKAKVALRSPKMPAKASKVLKAKKPRKKKLPTVKSMRNKADSLLTPIVKKNHPYCLLRQAENCAGVTQVAHHHVLKSKCTALRYELENLIPLCNACHCLLHSHETYYSSMIVEIKGLQWWRRLEAKKNQYTKADVHHYIAEHKRLQEILDNL